MIKLRKCDGTIKSESRFPESTIGRYRLGFFTSYHLFSIGLSGFNYCMAILVPPPNPTVSSKVVINNLDPKPWFRCKLDIIIQFIINFTSTIIGALIIS